MSSVWTVGTCSLVYKDRDAWRIRGISLRHRYNISIIKYRFRNNSRWQRDGTRGHVARKIRKDTGIRRSRLGGIDAVYRVLTRKLLVRKRDGVRLCDASAYSSSRSTCRASRHIKGRRATAIAAAAAAATRVIHRREPRKWRRVIAAALSSCFNGLVRRDDDTAQHILTHGKGDMTKKWNKYVVCHR